MQIPTSDSIAFRVSPPDFFRRTSRRSRKSRLENMDQSIQHPGSFPVAAGGIQKLPKRCRSHSFCRTPSYARLAVYRLQECKPRASAMHQLPPSSTGAVRHRRDFSSRPWHVSGSVSQIWMSGSREIDRALLCRPATIYFRRAASTLWVDVCAFLRQSCVPDDTQGHMWPLGVAHYRT